MFYLASHVPLRYFPMLLSRSSAVRFFARDRLNAALCLIKMCFFSYTLYSWYSREPSVKSLRSHKTFPTPPNVPRRVEWWKYKIISFSRSGIKAKRVVEFHRSTLHTSRIERKLCSLIYQTLSRQKWCLTRSKFRRRLKFSLFWINTKNSDKIRYFKLKLGVTKPSFCHKFSYVFYQLLFIFWRNNKKSSYIFIMNLHNLQKINKCRNGFRFICKNYENKL